MKKHKANKKLLNVDFQNYFIISYLSLYDKALKYSLSDQCIGISDFSEKFSIIYNKNNEEEYIIKIFSYTYNPSNINEPKTEIILSGYGIFSFSGFCTFNPKRNNFIYDFSFEIYKGELKDISPPKMLNLSKSEQFNFFVQFLESTFKYDNLISSLIDCSFDYLKDCYYLDFYLSILNNSDNRIIEILSYYDLDKVKLPESIDIKKYSDKLNDFKIFPNKITDYLTDDKRKETYLLIFYSIILYFRINYEPDKVNDLFLDNYANKYYIKILLSNNKHFENIPPLSYSFVNEIMGSFGKNLDIEKLYTTLNFLKKLDKILIFINEHSENILKTMKKVNNETESDDQEEEEEKEGENEKEEEKEEEENEDRIKEKNKKPKLIKKINLIKIINISNNDKIENIKTEIENLLDKTKVIKYLDIGKNFWKCYSKFFNKKNLDALIQIKTIIQIIKKKNNNLIENDDFIYFFIHETGKDMSINHKFKNNLDLLKFIKEEDIYYSSNKYRSYRDIEIFIDLKLSEIKENDNDFFKIWNSIDFAKVFDQEQFKNFQNLIISKAKDIETFHILFKLFRNFEEEIYNIDIINLLREQYISLIQNYNEKNIELFAEDSTLLIYLLDKKINFGVNFIKKDFINRFPSSFINKVFINLANQYKDKNISENLIEEIANFFTKNTENLKTSNFIEIISNLKNNKCFEFILKKIDKFFIKKELFFNNKENNKLEILKVFKKLEFFKNYEHTSYIIHTSTVSKQIFDDLINNRVKYNDFLIKINNLNSVDFKQKLEILNVNKKISDKEIEDIIKKLIDYKTLIEKKTLFLDKLLYIDKQFFSIIKQREIEELEILHNKILNGNLDEIDKNKKMIDEYEKNNSEEYINDIMKLSCSMFFLGIFNYLKKKDENEGNQNIFEDAFNYFSSLKQLFFEKIFSNSYNEILNICLNSVENDENRIYVEIKLIQDYFNINCDENKFEIIAKNLIVFRKKKKIIDMINGIKIFIRKTKAIKTNYLDNLESIKNDLLSEELNFNIINKNLELLEKEDLIIINKKNSQNNINNYLEIFIDFYSKQEAFKFLFSLKKEDISYLYEAINLSDNTFLNISDIQGMEKCKKFIKDLILDDIEDKTIIKNFITKAKNNENISACFKCFFENFLQIQELKNEIFNISKNNNKIKLKKVSNNSKFDLSIDDININEFNKKTTFVNFNGKYLLNNMNEQIFSNITLDELLELRNYSILDRKLGNAEEKELENYNKKFSHNIEQINKIFYLLNQIAIKGYQKKICIEINIINNESDFKLNNENSKKKYDEIITILENTLKQITNIQKNLYTNEETELRRFLYGRQFIFLNKCLIQERLELTWPLIDYITNDKCKYKIEKYKYERVGVSQINIKNKNQEINDINNTIFNCNNYLLEILKQNKLQIYDIYKENIINEEYCYKGLHYYFTFKTEIEEQIINLYLLLTKNLPLGITILICNKDTSIEEITSFLYRAFLCKFNTLFIMGKIEELQPEKYEILEKLTTQLYINKESEMKSCLIFFLYRNNESKIEKYIRKINSCQEIKIKNEKDFLKGAILDIKEVEIIESDSTGVGKSTKIKNDIENRKKKYVYFPLGGEFNKFEVINRLKKIPNLTNISIHFDIFDTPKIDLMKEFLFFIFITKSYSLYEDIFYLNKEIEIKIELPYGFIDLPSKFPLLKIIKNKVKISIKELPKLIVLKDINSDIQIVCNYLKIFKNKEIIDNDLYIKGISSEKINEYSNKKIAESIPDLECQNLIYEYLDVKFPNYYQIQNFIKILSSQFKKFSLVTSLSANALNLIIKNFGDFNLKINRYNIIKNIINNAKFLIKSSYENLLDCQNISYNTNNDLI